MTVATYGGPTGQTYGGIGTYGSWGTAPPTPDDVVVSRPRRVRQRQVIEGHGHLIVTLTIAGTGYVIAKRGHLHYDVSLRLAPGTLYDREAEDIALATGIWELLP
ncbi:MAG: hypothetical protein ACSLFP_16320 [Acidimicrobiales bacterium]